MLATSVGETVGSVLATSVGETSTVGCGEAVGEPGRMISSGSIPFMTLARKFSSCGASSGVSGSPDFAVAPGTSASCGLE